MELALARDPAATAGRRRQPHQKEEPIVGIRDGREASRVAGLMMSVAALTLGVASYLHRDGRIPLGFTVITGERFYQASIPEAVIGFVLAAAAVVVLVTPSQARPVALGATTFAILGVAYGLTVTVGSGRVADIAYTCVLMAVLLVTEFILLRRVAGRGGARARYRTAPDRTTIS